jgi:hypothetical protein
MFSFFRYVVVTRATPRHVKRSSGLNIDPKKPSNTSLFMICNIHTNVLMEQDQGCMKIVKKGNARKDGHK